MSKEGDQVTFLSKTGSTCKIQWPKLAHSFPNFRSLKDITTTYKKALLLINSFFKTFAREIRGMEHYLMHFPFERVLIGTGAALQTGKEAKVQKAGRFGLPPATSSLFLFFPLCPLSSFLPLSFLFLPFSFLWTRGKRKGRREGSWNNSLITRYCLHIFLVVLGLGNQ